MLMCWVSALIWQWIIAIILSSTVFCDSMCVYKYLFVIVYETSRYIDAVV